MSAKELWDEFLKANPAVPAGTPYQIWYFGNGPKMAAELEAKIREKLKPVVVPRKPVEDAEA